MLYGHNAWSKNLSEWTNFLFRQNTKYWSFYFLLIISIWHKNYTNISFMVKISSLLIFLTINNGFIKCTQGMWYVSKAIHFYKRDLQNVCRWKLLSSCFSTMSCICMIIFITFVRFPLAYLKFADGASGVGMVTNTYISYIWNINRLKSIH